MYYIMKKKTPFNNEHIVCMELRMYIIKINFLKYAQSKYPI